VHPRKNRPVLFEVVARTQRARPRTTPPQAPAAPPSPTSTSPTAVLAVTPPTPAATPGGWRRYIPLDFGGGDIRVVLSRPQAALVGVGLIVLLLAVFFIGRYSAGPLPANTFSVEDFLAAGPAPETPPTAAPAPTPGRGRNGGPIVTPPVQPGEEIPVAKGAPPPPLPPTEAGSPEASTLAHDSYYVVVQYFRLRDRPLADAALEFLRVRGVECTIRTGSDLQLVATEAFSSEQQAERLRKRIVDIGKEYRKSGGGYDFASARARKF
jgi:hypothetical protein